MYPPESPYGIDTSDSSYKPTVCVVTRSQPVGKARAGTVLCRDSRGLMSGPHELIMAEVGQFTEDGLTPTGWYLIGRLRDNFGGVPWFDLVQPAQDDDRWLTDWDEDENPYGRGQMGLHPGGISHGCITVNGSAWPPTTEKWNHLSAAVESGYVDMSWSFTTYRGFLCVEDVLPGGGTEFQVGCAEPSLGSLFGYSASRGRLFASQFRIVRIAPQRAAPAGKAAPEGFEQEFEADLLRAFPGLLQEVTTIDVTIMQDGSYVAYYYGLLREGVMPDTYLADLRAQLASGDSPLRAGDVTRFVDPEAAVRLCEPVDNTTMLDSLPCGKFDGCHFKRGELCGDADPSFAGSPPPPSSGERDHSSATLTVSRIGESANLLIGVGGGAPETQLKLLLKKVCVVPGSCFANFPSSHSQIAVSDVSEDANRSWFSISIATDDGLDMALECSLWKADTVIGDAALPAGALKVDYLMDLRDPLETGAVLSVRVGLEAPGATVAAGENAWSLIFDSGRFSVAFATTAEVDGGLKDVAITSSGEGDVIFVDLGFPAGRSFAYGPSVTFAFSAAPVLGLSHVMMMALVVVAMWL